MLPFAPVTRDPVIFDGVCFVRLSDGSVAVCDAADFDTVVRQKRWTVVRGYPYFTDYTGENPRTVKLHQLLNPEWPITDHINGNTRDNRRTNLRPCTLQQNAVNSASKPGTSKFKGVSWDSSRSRWISSIQINGRTHHLGRFSSELDAARAYDKRAQEVHGAFARLNVIGG